MLSNFILGFTNCASLQIPSISEAEVKPIVLKDATYYPETHMFSIADKTTLKKIKKESNGKIDFQYYS